MNKKAARSYLSLAIKVMRATFINIILDKSSINELEFKLIALIKLYSTGFRAKLLSVSAICYNKSGPGNHS